MGRGFIKELNWTNDGRFLASPYGFAVRLLSFDDSCRELCDVSIDCREDGTRRPVGLHEVPCPSSPLYVLAYVLYVRLSYVRTYYSIAGRTSGGLLLNC